MLVRRTAIWQHGAQPDASDNPGAVPYRLTPESVTGFRKQMPVYDQSANSIADALGWWVQLAIGPLGTAVAILTVAGLGLSMLQGRLPTRRGAAAIAGCFILFSSPAIAAGLLSLGGGGSTESTAALVAEPPAYVAPIPQPVPYDPYAGASVPVRPQDSARDLTPK